MRMFLSIMFLCVTVFIVTAEEPTQDNPVSVTNIVKSPVVMKGLYGNRTKPGGDRPHTTDTAVVNALRFFKETQNIDGSWGAKGEQHLATPLVLLSFLGHGETKASSEFGDTVAGARRWLLSATPTETTDRLAAAVALSAYCDLCYPSEQPEKKTNEVTKIQTLLHRLSPDKTNRWMDFAAFKTMPGDRAKPAWMRRTKKLQKKYLNETADLSPSTVDEYLAGYLVALAAFHQGGKTWAEFNRTSTPELMKRQQSSGAFSTAPGQNRFAATALAVLRLEVYYQYAPHFSRAASQTPDRDDQDIPVNVE